MFKHLRLHLDQAHDGPMNMAIDQALLETTQVPVLRVYQWTEPTISIGYSHDLAALQPTLSDWPVVRRWTGGGVVWHAADTTYSLIVPANDPWSQTRPVESYRQIHGSLAASLKASVRDDCRLACAADQRDGVLCFESPALADIVCGAQKIAGAGQRRTREGLLHQGSVKLILGEAFWVQWARSLAKEVQVERTISASVMSRADELFTSRYATAQWLTKA